MLPRIGIPWYRATIKTSVFEDASSPRGFNFKVPKRTPNPPEIEPLPSQEPDLVTVPSTVPETVISPVKSPVPGTIPGTVPKPIDIPVPKPIDIPVPKPIDIPVPKPIDIPVPKPIDVPIPKPIDVPVPKPILPAPRPTEEGRREPLRNPIPTMAEMLEAQKKSRIKSINEMAQYDMLIQRNLSRQKELNSKSQFTTKNLEAYNLFIEHQNATVYEKLTMSKGTRLTQIKLFNEKLNDVEKKLGGGKDIVLDYISNNRISFGSLPNDYKEINKELAKAGIQGVGIGAIAYILYQIAKVTSLAL